MFAIPLGANDITENLAGQEQVDFSISVHALFPETLRTAQNSDGYKHVVEQLNKNTVNRNWTEMWIKVKSYVLPRLLKQTGS